MNQLDQWNRKIRTIWYCSSLYMEYKNAMRKSKKMSMDKKTEYWEKKHEEFATKMLNNIYELKGWWVKVGQFLSTQENIMPSAYIEKFTNLQNMMPTSSYDKIEEILKRELGDLKEIFESIDKKPLASASIGQVHRAKILKRNNIATAADEYNVIVKVQHEGIDHFLSSDIAILKNVSWAFGLIDKNFHFNDFIDEWQDSAALELNYKYELFHQILAYNTFKKSQIPLKIPKIYCAYTTTKVLVMEYINGFKITDLDLIKKHNIDKYKLVYSIIDYFAFQIHNDGFFHGDPHPGNLLIMIKEKKKKKKKNEKTNTGKEILDDKNERDVDNERLKKKEFITSAKLRSIDDNPGNGIYNEINANLLKSELFDSYSFTDEVNNDLQKNKLAVIKDSFSDDLNFVRKESSKMLGYWKGPTRVAQNWFGYDFDEKEKHKLDVLKKYHPTVEKEKKNEDQKKMKINKASDFFKHRFFFSERLRKKKEKCQKKKKRKVICTPVIIDWGLIKRLDIVMQLAFCKLIYSISCMNVLNIIEAFEDMGFCFKEDFTYDPEIYIENLKRYFLKKLEESSKTVENQMESNESNGDRKDKKKNSPSNFDLLKNMDKTEALDKNPISGVPKDIIFFIRVASLLHGLCTQLDVKVNYLSIFAKRAKEALENIYTPISNSIYTLAIDKRPNSYVEKRIHEYLKKLYEQKKILGCQLAIIHKTKLVVNTCVGITSNTDKRPITKHSLFNGYCLNKCILTLALIHMVTNSVKDQHSFENNNIFTKFENFRQKELRSEMETIESTKKKVLQNKSSYEPMQMHASENVLLNNKVNEKDGEQNKNLAVKEDKQKYKLNTNIILNNESDLTNEINHDTSLKEASKITENLLGIERKKEVEAQREIEKERKKKREIANERLRKYIEKKQIANFKNTINDNICNYWDGFICKNKKNIRIKDLLSQKCFLEKPFHDKITLSKFIDYDQMINMIENAKNYKQKKKSRKHGKYLYLIYSYIVAELIHTMSGLKYNDYIYKYIIRPLHLKKEMYVPIPSYFLKQKEKKPNENDNTITEKEKKSVKENSSFNIHKKEQTEKKKDNGKKGNISSSIAPVQNMTWNVLSIPSFSSKVNEDVNKKNHWRNSLKINGNRKSGQYSNDETDISRCTREANCGTKYSIHSNNIQEDRWNNINNKLGKTRNTSIDVYYSHRNEAKLKKKSRDETDEEEDRTSLRNPSNSINEGIAMNNGHANYNRELLYQYNVNEYITRECNDDPNFVEVRNGKKMEQSNKTVNINFNETNSLNVKEEKQSDAPECVTNNNLVDAKNKSKGFLKSTFLNKVDNFKEKTKRFNDSIKNIYGNNENTFLKKIFLQQKKNTNSTIEENAERSEKIEWKQQKEKGNVFAFENVNTHKDSYFGKFIRKKKKDTGSFKSNGEENILYASNNTNPYNDNVYNIVEDKRINNNLTFPYSHREAEVKKKEETNKSLSGCALSHCKNKIVLSEQRLVDSFKDISNKCKKKNPFFDQYNIDSCSFICLNGLNEQPKDEYVGNSSSEYDLQENGEKIFQKFVEKDNKIQTLFRNTDTKSSDDESVNSLLEEKYNTYHKKSKKYKQFFQYLKCLKRGLFRMQDSSNNCSQENSKELIEVSEKKKNEKSKKKKDKEDQEISNEELMRKLIEHKYFILNKQKNQIMGKKTKGNIYNNEHSDDIEMFSDSTDNESDESFESNESICNSKNIMTKNVFSKRKDGIKRKQKIRMNKEMNKNEKNFINEKKKQLEIYLIMNNLYKTNKKSLIGVENHTINKHTDILWRLAFARRTINIIDNISQTDMTKKIENFKDNLKSKKCNTGKENNGNNNNNNNNADLINDQEKIIHDVKEIDKKIKLYAENFNVKTYNKYISIFQLAKVKPYILDPLIYDSKKILDKFIPINGRFTAKALCKLFAFMNNQFFFPKYVLNKIRKEYTKDESLESFLLTAGMSRTWGLGFQLFECEYEGEINEDFYLAEIDEKKKRKNEKKEKKEKKKEKKNSSYLFSRSNEKNIEKTVKPSKKTRTIVGYGQSDISGCLALSFPEIDFSLTILLTDIFKGPQVSHLILEYILKLYGIKPKWKLPVHVSEIIKIF